MTVVSVLESKTCNDAVETIIATLAVAKDRERIDMGDVDGFARDLCRRVLRELNVYDAYGCPLCLS